MKWTGERVIWREPVNHLPEFRKTLDWYAQAMEHARGKRVLDAACGTGFGSFLLSIVAREVMGIDVQDMYEEWDPLINAASSRDLRFGVHDLETTPADYAADLCVSIETIEHLRNPELFLSSIRATSLFFTIPCYGDKNNTFHKIEYTEKSAAELIRKYFPALEYRMENRRMIGLAHKKV